MSLLAFLLRASRGAVVLSIVAGLVSGLTGVGMIVLIHAALERAPGSPGWLGAAFFGLCLVSALTRVLAQASMVRLAQGTACRLCLSLCRRLLSVPLRTFEGLDPAAVLAVLTEDIVVMANAVVGFPQLGINLPIVVVCLAYVGWLSPAVFLWGVVFAALAIASYAWLTSKALGHLTIARAGQETLVAHFRALIDGFRELKSHRGRREAFYAEGLQAAAETARDRSIAGMTLFSVAGSWSQVAFFGFIGTLLFILPGTQSLGRDVLSGAVLVVLYIMAPLDVIMTWVPMLGRARVSLRRIEALAPSLNLADDALATPSPALFESSVELRNVTYAYDRGRERGEFVLGPVNLSLRPEEIVFLVGGNGSGKTTLVKLLAGLYVPDQGSIRLDGRPVTAEGLEAYRQLFSVIFTDGHLFQKILGLDPEGLDERARDHLVRFELEDRVGVEGGAFSTVGVSQGQRKRLALLTALLEDRPICVLDEWAANQDPYFKKFFYHEILPEWRARGKTLLVITHDEDYFHVADRVVRLDSGRLLGDEVHVVQENRV